MIDTLNMTIRETRSGGGLFDVARHIENVKEGVYSRGGEQYAIGSIGNYRVYVDSRNVRLSGSIAKLAQCGENVSSPSRAAVADGVQWLSDTLHLNVGAAAVGRVDVAYTFSLPSEPATYIAEMSSRAGTERASIGENTVYFVSKGRALCFYDKRAEMRHRGQEMPPAWAECQNLLRYELRLSGSIGQQIGLQSLTASDITKPQPWARLVDMWAQEYRQVVKANADAIKAASTQREAFDAIFADLLRYAPTDYLSDALRLTKEGGKLSKIERYRLKKALQKIVAASNIELVNQLDAAVEQARAEAVSV